MKSGWYSKSLGDLCYLAGRIGWKGLTAKEYTKEGPFFLSVHGLNHGDYVDFRDAFHISQTRYDESPEIMLRPRDVLLCKDGAGIGKVGIVGDLPGPSTINSSLLLLRAEDGLLPKYLYFALCSPLFQDLVRERINGATTPHLYQRDIRELKIPLPSIPDQQRIVGVLDQVFVSIAIAKANAEKALANAQAVFANALDSAVQGKLEWEQKCSQESVAELLLQVRSVRMAAIADGRAKAVKTTANETHNLPNLASSLN
jgi:type I restriction enzyme S subunit